MRKLLLILALTAAGARADAYTWPCTSWEMMPTWDSMDPIDPVGAPEVLPPDDILPHLTANCVVDWGNVSGVPESASGSCNEAYVLCKSKSTGEYNITVCRHYDSNNNYCGTTTTYQYYISGGDCTDLWENGTYVGSTCYVYKAGPPTWGNVKQLYR